MLNKCSMFIQQLLIKFGRIASIYPQHTHIHKKILHRQPGPSHGSSSPFSPLRRRGLNPIKAVYDPDRPDGRFNLTSSAFNQLGQYTSSPGHRGYCYTELAFSVAVTIASTHCAYLWRGGQAKLAWVAGYVVRLR